MCAGQSSRPLKRHRVWLSLILSSACQPHGSLPVILHYVQLPREQDSDMPSNKAHERRPHRDGSPTPGSDNDLPPGVSPISESDYFLKNTEFRMWLKEEKDKVCPILSLEEIAHR
jgi:hypothetical protein